MNRREFMRTMFGTAVSIAVPQIWTPKLPIISSREMRIPLEFQGIYGGARGGGKSFGMADLIELEMKRVMPKVKTLFDRDDIFYKLIDDKNKK